jgi:hypothetical protein
MSWTKRQFVVKAFSELGLGAYIFDSNPEKLQDGVVTLDAMMGMWNSEGIRIGYPIPSSPENTDLDEETGVPDSANMAIYKSLAVELAPGIGKTPSPDSKITANRAKSALMGQTSSIEPVHMRSTMPIGQGNKSRGSRRRRFFPGQAQTIDAGKDSEIEFE